MMGTGKSRKPSWVTEYVGVNFEKVPNKPADAFAPPAAVDTEPAVLKRPTGSSRRPLYLAVFAAYLGTMAFGFAITYSSPALPDLRPKMNFTVEDSAWFGSLVKCGSIFGGLLGGNLVNVIGRRATLFVSCGWFLAGWLCIIFAQSIPLLFSGRALTGVAVGIVAPAVPVFISEICPSHIRGLLNTGSNVSLFCGILATYVLGKYLAYQHLAIALMAPTVFMSVLLFWTKESPRWLLQKGHRKAALESALFYYGPEGKKELAVIEESLCGIEQFRLRDLAVPHIYRPFLCMLLVMFVQQSSTVTVLVVYTHDIFREAGTSIPSDDCSIIIGVVQVVVVAIATVLTDRVGRKILLLVSTFATSMCLFLFGYSFYLKQHSPETFANSYTWLPIASVGLIFVAFNIGMGHLPWVLLGEMLPLRVKGFATGFCTAFAFGYSFLLIKEFYTLQLFLGVAGSYWLFGTLLLVGCVLFWIFLPETKRKTLEEIEQLFGKRAVDFASEAAISKSNRVDHS
ncbi:solute carrier family 2, facilitated glucose transporter member 8 isoform X3 [Dermacentor silvarum]|uniref:solute carrier family 2, facilitated glucose transporter member 8 isoform X3 n=1 Tax=Dermacentor silvarum TaxID=543639 RepID=UPI00210107F6|nr:solute carrier family 2, facilitated glucose transporter member 8 isoform X3 [Dermacentor silvarum]